MGRKFNRILQLVVCAAIVSTSIGCASTPRTERSAGQYVDDSVVTTRVKTAIFKEDTLKSMQIEVKTYRGVVQLSGFVDSAQSVSRAADVARRVEGVNSVDNSLLVKK